MIPCIMTLHVHLIDPPEDDFRVQFERSLEPTIRLTVGASPPADCTILVSGRLNPELLAAGPELTTVIIPWAGVPRQTREVLLENPHLAVHNLHHNAAATAEMAMALLLAAAKSVVPLDRALRSGDWRPRYRGDHSIELKGKTALILGYGAIGSHVARTCLALGMHVLATRRQARTVGNQDGIEIHSPSALSDLLPRAHVLLVCLPLTPETEGLVGERELALLPPQAILVNIGRGPIVDEAALFAALESRRLRAAGIDVWYRYPEDEAAWSGTFPSRFPFHELENVVLSPHRGGDNVETESDRLAALAALLNAAARGEPMPNRVDLARGY